MLFDLLERLAQKHQVSMLLTEKYDPAFVERYRAAGVKILGTTAYRDHDVFLANTLISFPMVVKFGRRMPTAWWIHEPAFGLKFIESGKVDKAAFRAATRVVFPNAWAARDLYRPWLEGTTWSVVPTAIPPVAGVRRKRESDDRFRLVHVGSFEYRKGQDVSIKALRALSDEAFELRFVGLDEGRWARKGKDYLARFPGTARQVVWCGKLSPAETLQEIADADALLLPARDELFPLVILEAMSLGVPVISSAYGAIAEDLADGEDALLVAPGDHDALASAVRRLRDEPGLSESLVRNALDRVIAKRPYDAFVRAMEAELYSTVETFHCRATA